MPRDYYAESRALGVALWDVGLKSWADKIGSVIEQGFTASEILMGLRWTLDQLLAQETSLSTPLKDRATELRTAIDRALSRQ